LGLDDLDDVTVTLEEVADGAAEERARVGNLLDRLPASGGGGVIPDDFDELGEMEDRAWSHS
jgi:hypothetical protein